MSRALKPEPARRRRWARSLLRPGVLLMLRLRMNAKLALIATSVLLPLAALMTMSVQAQLEVLRVTQLEIEGATLSDLLAPLTVETQKHRGLTHRLLGGDASATAGRDDARRALKEAIAALDQRLAGGLHYRLDDAWQPLRGLLTALAEGRHPAAPAAAFAAHTEAVDALRQFSLLNGERSGLVLDPEPRVYFLMDVVVNGVLPVAESAAQARGLGSALLVGGPKPDLDRATVLVQAGALRRGIDDLAGKLAALERAGGEVPGSWPQARELALKLAQAIQDAFGGAALVGDTRVYFDLGTATIGQVVALQRDAALRLANELRQRQQRVERQLSMQALGFAAGLAALGYLLASFTVTFRRSLAALQAGTEAIANGDLASRVDVQGHDELADVGRVVDAMSHRLSALVAEIRNSASLVNLTGQQVSAGSSRLASRTDEQASSLRCSVSAIGELSAAVAHNADAACRLDTLTGRLATQAEEGNAAMQDTVQAMDQMRQASDRVAEVVAVIDDVAFQTGMLSLNAAIEAARAGEAGKGFAVVASEVRLLARRCAESAEEIRHLIGDAASQVQISAEKLGHVSGALGTIVEGVREVSQQLRSISASSTHQSDGLRDVTQNVGNLDEITRENAALVEESSTASHALVERATKLREAVASMRLRQGSADEALALVQRAREHIAQRGRPQAMADFNRPDGDWIDRDLYIFSLDRNGIFSAFGANPAIVGQAHGAVPGLDSDFPDKVWAMADAGGGWVQYEVLHPLTKEVSAKESYVQLATDGTLVGCGIYRSEVPTSNRKDKPRAVAWARSCERVLADSGA
jgi:methyl-accepting chemotaxis protein